MDGFLEFCVIKSFIKKVSKGFVSSMSPSWIVRWGSVVSIVTRLQVWQPGIHSSIPGTARDMFFLEMLPSLALGRAWALIQWVRNASPGIKQQECEADHLSPSKCPV